MCLIRGQLDIRAKFSVAARDKDLGLSVMAIDR